LHYSVTESSGSVSITVLKRKVGHELSFGIRTIEGTAKENSEFERLDKITSFGKSENEKTIEIKIYDNDVV